MNRFWWDKHWGSFTTSLNSTKVYFCYRPSPTLLAASERRTEYSNKLDLLSALQLSSPEIFCNKKHTFAGGVYLLNGKKVKENLKIYLTTSILKRGFHWELFIWTAVCSKGKMFSHRERFHNCMEKSWFYWELAFTLLLKKENQGTMLPETL